MREMFATYRRVLLFCGVSLAAWSCCAVAHLFPDGAATAMDLAHAAPSLPPLLAPVHPAVVAGFQVLVSLAALVAYGPDS